MLPKVGRPGPRVSTRKEPEKVMPVEPTENVKATLPWGSRTRSASGIVKVAALSATWVV